MNKVHMTYSESDNVFALELFIRRNAYRLTNEQVVELNQILSNIDAEMLDYEMEEGEDRIVS